MRKAFDKRPLRSSTKDIGRQNEHLSQIVDGGDAMVTAPPAHCTTRTTTATHSDRRNIIVSSSNGHHSLREKPRSGARNNSIKIPEALPSTLPEPLRARVLLSDARREARRLLLEAREQSAVIVDEARTQAAEMLATAKAQAPAQKDAAGKESPLTRLRAARVPATSVHSSEISARSFRKVVHGLDGHAVREWLSVVQASHAALEDELDRLRWGWDEMLIASARASTSGSNGSVEQSNPWRSLARSIDVGRPDPQLISPHTGSTRNALAGAVRGRRQTRAALAEASTQLARMQHDNALLLRANEELRTQLIQTIVEGRAS